jgi:hypothetical protein
VDEEDDEDEYEDEQEDAVIDIPDEVSAFNQSGRFDSAPYVTRSLLRRWRKRRRWSRHPVCCRMRTYGHASPWVMLMLSRRSSSATLIWVRGAMTRGGCPYARL